MKKWHVIRPYLITWIIMEAVAVFILFFASRDRWVLPIGINVMMIPFYIMCFFDLHSRCPICGKRHLRRYVRCAGTRYTLYDAYCPVHDQWIDVQRDWEKGETTYFKMWEDWKYGEDRKIIPVWEKKE